MAPDFIMPPDIMPPDDRSLETDYRNAPQELKYFAF
jgi:hypothetical protein